MYSNEGNLCVSVYYKILWIQARVSLHPQAPQPQAGPDSYVAKVEYFHSPG